MKSIKNTVAVAAVVAGIAGTALGAGIASAEPPPPLPPTSSYDAPPWAPKKPPPPFWAKGNPVVWDTGWGGRWGVWMGDGFLTLT